MTQNAAPEHFKPFDIELAKQGIPYKLLCGWDVTIFKFDARGPGGPIVGICGADDRPSSWRSDGAYSIVDNPRMALVHPPLGYVDEKPVYFGDELHDETGAKHKAFVGMNFDAPIGWSWPKLEKSSLHYPVTRMTSPELTQSFDANKMFIIALEDVANAALRHAIDAGQVVTAKVFGAMVVERDALVIERKTRDNAIAMAVGKHVALTVSDNIAAGLNHSKINLAPIIAGVKD